MCRQRLSSGQSLPTLNNGADRAWLGRWESAALDVTAKSFDNR